MQKSGIYKRSSYIIWRSNRIIPKKTIPPKISRLGLFKYFECVFKILFLVLFNSFRNVHLNSDFDLLILKLSLSEYKTVKVLKLRKYEL